MKKDILLIDLHYLPNILYFSLFNRFSTIILETCEYYEKQSYRNRCLINGANGVEKLIIPVKTKKKMPINEVKIEYNENWDRNHVRAIQSSYGKAPFFEFYKDYFFEIYNRKNVYLKDLNVELLTLCLSLLGMQKKILFTEKYKSKYEGNILDARGHIHPKKIFDLQEKPKFVSYLQNFGNVFVANLSLVDLLFCCGPESKKYVENTFQS